MSLLKYLHEILGPSGASGRDNRNGDRIGHRSGQFTIESRRRAVSVHRSQQDFAGTSRRGVLGPLQHIAFRFCTSSMRIGLPMRAVRTTLGVNGNDYSLRAEALRDARD